MFCQLKRMLEIIFTWGEVFVGRHELMFREKHGTQFNKILSLHKIWIHSFLVLLPENDQSICWIYLMKEQNLKNGFY